MKTNNASIKVMRSAVRDLQSAMNHYAAAELDRKNAHVNQLDTANMKASDATVEMRLAIEQMISELSALFYTEGQLKFDEWLYLRKETTAEVLARANKISEIA